MATLKVGNLGYSDVKRYKSLVELSIRYVDVKDGEKININKSYENLTPVLFNDKIKMIVSKIEDIGPHFKKITIRNEKEKKIALFKPGQYISITIVLEGKIMTRIYTIVSTIKDAKLYEYSFIVEEADNGKMGDFLFHSAKVGDDLIVSGPYGDFYYDEIRDKENMICLASPNGILPFIAMAENSASGDFNNHMKIFYSTKKYEDLVLIDYLKEIVDRADNVELYVILSDEEKEGTIHGVITSEQVQGIFDKNCTIYASGEEGFLKYLNKELDKMKLPKKFIRCNMYKPKCNIKKVKGYMMTVNVGEEQYKFPCYNNKTILEVVEDNNLYIPNRCYIGTCGLCKTKLINGKVKVVNDRRSKSDIDSNLICPCSSYPMSDIEITIR